MEKIDLKDRDFLTKLSEAAWEGSQISELNQGWQRVYLRLFDAANELDAFLGRSSVSSE